MDWTDMPAFLLLRKEMVGDSQGYTKKNDCLLQYILSTCTRLISIFLYLDYSDLDAPVRGGNPPCGSLRPPGPPARGLQYLQVRHIHIFLEISTLFLYVMT